MSFDCFAEISRFILFDQNVTDPKVLLVNHIPKVHWHTCKEHSRLSIAAEIRSYYEEKTSPMVTTFSVDLLDLFGIII